MSFVEENFELLYGIGKCIAEQFGPNCEVVLHDLTKPYENTIVAIWNGHVTGRKLGDGGTDAGLKILKGTAQPEDTYNYINSTRNGQILRSSSKYLKDKEGRVVGSMCINFDITEILKGPVSYTHLVGNLTMQPLITFLCVGAIYFVICYSLSLLSSYTERRMKIK